MIVLTALNGAIELGAQQSDPEMLTIDAEETFQTLRGFGASLAYYEGWLNAHPTKSEVYQAIFGELSLDILRVRNAHEYDPEMVGRVQEYMEEAEQVLGHPIALFSTSWGPPGRLKNTGDRKNGGTLRYTVGEHGVEFDYAGFAAWWKSSLQEYIDHGFCPTYISIQNEPDWSADYETCLLRPSETVNGSDTIAGYSRALQAVFDTLATLDNQPKILGPETVGIGYNSVENYVNALDHTLLDGISHHLYHGVDENNPWASADFSKLGSFHTEIPHFQTEYSRGDWYALGGLIYKSLVEERAVAYLYWDLIWESGGLVTLEFPWDRDRWTDPTKGYIKTKDFYAFKQFSAYLHPGWNITNHTITEQQVAVVTAVSPGNDSAACVLINRSATEQFPVHLAIPGYRIAESGIYRTSVSENGEARGPLTDSTLTVPPRSITTVDMRIVAYDPADDTQAPTVPQDLQASGVTENSCTLSWNPSGDDIGIWEYRIYAGDSLAGVSAIPGYTLSGLQPGTDYRVTVIAADHAGNQSGSSDTVNFTTLVPDTDAPSAPLGLQATEVSVYSYHLSWEPSTDNTGVTEYRVFANNVWVGSTPISEYTLSELISGNTYQVVVVARDGAGNVSDPSESVTIAILIPDTTAPVVIVPDSIHFQELLEVHCSEDARIYLVPEGTGGSADAIRAASIDSMFVHADTAIFMNMGELANGTYWLFGIDSVLNLSQPVPIVVSGVGIDRKQALSFSVYPNPAEEWITLRFTLSEPHMLVIRVWDVTGREVVTEQLGIHPAGKHHATLPVEGLDGGVYLIRLEEPGKAGLSRRIMVKGR